MLLSNCIYNHLLLLYCTKCFSIFVFLLQIFHTLHFWSSKASFYGSVKPRIHGMFGLLSVHQNTAIEHWCSSPGTQLGPPHSDAYLFWSVSRCDCCVLTCLKDCTRRVFVTGALTLSLN